MPMSILLRTIYTYLLLLPLRCVLGLILLSSEWYGARTITSTRNQPSSNEQRLLFYRHEARTDIAKCYRNAIATIPPALSQADRLSALPPELRALIYENLDYGSALALARTNHFFSSEDPGAAIEREQRATFTFYAETFPANSESLACYGCLRVLPQTSFAEAQRRGQFTRFGSQLGFGRRCVGCSSSQWEARSLRRGVMGTVRRSIWN